jgi:hypothetical protein
LAFRQRVSPHGKAYQVSHSQRDTDVAEENVEEVRRASCKREHPVSVFGDEPNMLSNKVVTRIGLSQYPNERGKATQCGPCKWASLGLRTHQHDECKRCCRPNRNTKVLKVRPEERDLGVRGTEFEYVSERPQRYRNDRNKEGPSGGPLSMCPDERGQQDKQDSRQ